MDNHYRIDEDCRLFREIRRLSQSDLANKLGIGLATVNRWENMQTAVVPNDKWSEKTDFPAD